MDANAPARRERLRAVAEDMLREEDVHLVLVSRQFADQYRVWSDPLQILIEPRDDGLVEITCRRYPDERADTTT